jgi:hypothetical protein
MLAANPTFKTYIGAICVNSNAFDLGDSYHRLPGFAEGLDARPVMRQPG